MAETTAQPPAGGLSRAEEEAAYYHESGLNASWTGARLAAGAMSFLFGCFFFAFFYLKSLNSHHLWYNSAVPGPKTWLGTLIMAFIVVSALVQWGALQRIKAGQKRIWIQGATLSLVLGLAAVCLQIYQLGVLGFWPGSSGFASVFVGFYPVFLAVVFCVMVWLEILIMRCRPIPQISFVEQPPTYAEAFSVQRFQAALSGFTLIWNYLAVIAILFWILFYLVK
jgi:heme/copper-type cytochrome/quinol oxidase subunit 3